MNVEVFDGSDERLAVAACCLQTPVLAKICQNFQGKPFANVWANLVFSWAATHYRQFNAAPGAAVLTAIFGEWSTTADRTTRALVEKFLSALQPVDMNDDYCIELIERLVTRNVVKTTVDRANAALSNGEVQRAVDVIQQFKNPTFGTSSDNFVNPFENVAVIDDALSEAHLEPLIKFPAGSPIAQWLGPTMHRDALVMFLAADKAGKSATLSSCCQRALLQGKKVAMFNLGDLSQSQCLKRWTTALVGKPIRAGRYRIPNDITVEENEIKVTFDERMATDGYSNKEAKAAWDKAALRGDKNRLRIVTTPARSCSVTDLDNRLAAWANNGWVPDVLAVDYVGLLSRNPDLPAHESIDNDYAQLRAISSKYKILVLGASQAKSSAYAPGARWLSMADFAGSKGILSHSNAVIGIQADVAERQNQACRWNYLVLREAEHLLNLPSRYLAIAGAPAIGRYHLISTFM
jgi:hypothetical protein